MGMREIKFRGWDKENKVMAYNIQAIYDAMCLEKFKVSAEDWWRTNFPVCCFGSLLGEDNIAVMQYTGFHDKNGKEIYEGDIVKWFDGFWEIKWNLGRWSICGKLFEYNFSPVNHSEMEVINNIWENPELLK